MLHAEPIWVTVTPMSTSPTLRATVAGAIRAEMARRRLNASDLATALGCSRSSAARRLAGETRFDLDEVATVAEWLGLAPASLL